MSSSEPVDRVTFEATAATMIALDSLDRLVDEPRVDMINRAIQWYAATHAHLAHGGDVGLIDPDGTVRIYDLQ